MSEYRFARKSSKKFGEVYEPPIPVEIIGPNKTVEALMVVDSGADISLLPHWVAEIVGLHLNSENRRDIHGIGDESIPYILDTVRMRIADSEITPRIAWALGEEVPFVLLASLDDEQFDLLFADDSGLKSLAVAPWLESRPLASGDRTRSGLTVWTGQGSGFRPAGGADVLDRRR